MGMYLSLFLHVPTRAHLTCPVLMQIGAWQILCTGASADDACRLVNAFGPFAVFRDASNVLSDFRLTPEDCLRVRGLSGPYSSPCQPCVA